MISVGSLMIREAKSTELGPDLTRVYEAVNETRGILSE